MSELNQERFFDTRSSKLGSEHGLDQGNPWQVELAIDQLYVMRPLPRLAQGDCGIRGLLLGSDGQHPGVGPTLLPGWLAARRLLGS